MPVQDKRLPAKVNMPNGDVFVPVLIKIETRYDDGRPETVTLIPDDYGVEANRDDCFMIGYVRAETMQERPVT